MIVLEEKSLNSADAGCSGVMGGIMPSECSMRVLCVGRVQRLLGKSTAQFPPDSGLNFVVSVHHLPFIYRSPSILKLLKLHPRKSTG